MTVLVVLAASVVAIGVEEEDDVEVLAAEVAHSKHGMMVMAGKYHEETGKPCPIQWESHMEEEPFQNPAVEVRILLWIIYEMRGGKRKRVQLIALVHQMVLGCNVCR